MKINAYKVIGILVFLASLFQLFQLVKGIEASAASRNETFIKTPVAINGLPNRITIPKIDLDLPVVSVPLINGTWQVNDGVANFAEETSSVNSTTGNVGIFAHDRDDGFRRIKELEVGDEIEVKGTDFRAVYVVSDFKVVSTSRVDVFYPTTSPKLTLVTCEGAFSETRYALRADLKELQRNES